MMQMDVIKVSIASGLNFSAVVFDSWYFSFRLVELLGQENMDWIAEAKSNGKILVNGSWVKLRDYAASLNIRNMDAYSIDGNTYLMKSIIVKASLPEDARKLVWYGKAQSSGCVASRNLCNTLLGIPS